MKFAPIACFNFRWEVVCLFMIGFGTGPKSRLKLQKLWIRITFCGASLLTATGLLLES